MNKRTRRPRLGQRMRRVLAGLFSALLALSLAAVFYLFAILGEAPETDEDVWRVEDEPLAAQQPVTVSDAAQLSRLRGAFSGSFPVLGAQSGFTLLSGETHDAALPGGDIARLLTLEYAAGDARATVRAAAPAAGAALFPSDGLAVQLRFDATLSGLPAAYMAGGDTHRLAASDDGHAYVFTATGLSERDFFALAAQLSFSAE